MTGANPIAPHNGRSGRTDEWAANGKGSTHRQLHIGTLGRPLDTEMKSHIINWFK